jgi:L-ascorbate metabolism protein UlaG (beta-lactamase superfamily)
MDGQFAGRYERSTLLMGQLTITRIAHATTLIDYDGAAILTDPWFSQKFTYYPGEPLGVALADLPTLAGVIVSHGHYDHYDMDAFRAYPDKSVPFAVKRGIAEKARKVGFGNVTELDPWETVQMGPFKVTAAPAKHGVPEITFVLEAGGYTVYFGADTLLIPALQEIPQRFPKIDLALLAINGLKIRPMLNKQVVMNLQEAAEVCRILRVSHAVPIHYAYTAGPLGDALLLKHSGTPEEFAQEVARRAPQTQAHILPPGKPLVLDVSLLHS